MPNISVAQSQNFNIETSIQAAVHDSRHQKLSGVVVGAKQNSFPNGASALVFNIGGKSRILLFDFNVRRQQSRISQMNLERFYVGQEFLTNFWQWKILLLNELVLFAIILIRMRNFKFDGFICLQILPSFCA